jgi:hypothetical protein
MLDSFQSLRRRELDISFTFLITLTQMSTKIFTVKSFVLFSDKEKELSKPTLIHCKLVAWIRKDLLWIRSRLSKEF